jgi:hypothetical protein
MCIKTDCIYRKVDFQLLDVKPVRLFLLQILQHYESSVYFLSYTASKTEENREELKCQEYLTVTIKTEP